MLARTLMIVRHIDIPVTEDTDENLTNDNTTDFEILHSRDPSGTADLEVLPTRSEGRVKKGSEIANREQYVAGNQVSKLCHEQASTPAYPSRPRPAPGMTMFLI